MRKTAKNLLKKKKKTLKMNSIRILPFDIIVVREEMENVSDKGKPE